VVLFKALMRERGFDTEVLVLVCCSANPLQFRFVAVQIRYRADLLQCKLDAVHT
jgi:hypothetical protein